MSRRRLSWFALVLSVVCWRAEFAAAAEKTPLTVDDLYRQESITDFTVSPRGDEAVYVRNWYDASQPGRRTALWRVDGETGRAEPLEAGEPDGRMPVYSPDGASLAFVSDRERIDSETAFAPAIPPYSDPSGSLYIANRKDGGLVVLPLSGGAEAMLTDGFYGRIAFASNGDNLVYVASTPWVRRRTVEHGVILPHEDQGEGYEGYPAARLALVDFSGKRSPYTMDFRWYGDPQWMPDSRGLIFHSNRSDDQESVRYSINKNFDLWRVGVEGTNFEERRDKLTTNPGPDVSPRVSPDGKHVLYLSVPRNGPHMDVFNLCVLALDEEGAKPKVLINAHDAERDDDGTPPFQPTFPLRDDSWIDEEHVRVRGVRGLTTETMVFHIGGPDVPISAAAKPEPEPPANNKLKPPATNAWLAERYRAREEVVRWKSFDGLGIEGILTLPPEELKQYVKPYPMIVYPHGGPHSASKPGFNFTAHLFAAHGYAVFQPNFRGTYGYGRKFLDAARFDMGGSDMQDILTGVDMLIERGDVDAERQYLYGISYGGYSTCRLVTLTDRFRAACAQNAVTDLHAMWHLSDLQSWTEWEFGGKPWETVEHEGRKIDVGALMRDRSPTTHAHKVKTPTLLLHSDHDRRCPLAMGQMFYRALKENGCETELVIYKDERHGMWRVKHQADALRRTLAWFEAHK